MNLKKFFYWFFSKPQPFHPVEQQNCSNCYYSRTDPEFETLMCCFNPPMVSSDKNSETFPFVYEDSWCGKWCKNEF